MARTATAQKRFPGEERPWPRGTLLEGLSPASRGRLLRMGELRQCEPGSVILWEGERSDHVILLQQAVVKITASLENGRVALLGIRVSGDLVGEMAAFDGSLRSASVTVCGRAAIRIIQRAEFLGYLSSRPDANLAMYQMIIRRLRFANRRRVDFNGYSTRIRLARILVELADQYGHDTHEGIAFDDLTQDELGALVGADADTVGKELREFRARGMVGTGYRRIVIRNLGVLRSFAHVND